MSRRKSEGKSPAGSGTTTPVTVVATKTTADPALPAPIAELFAQIEGELQAAEADVREAKDMSATGYPVSSSLRLSDLLDSLSATTDKINGLQKLIDEASAA